MCACVSSLHTIYSNAINGTNVYIIYAQTPKFSLAGARCVDPLPLLPTTTACAAAAPTVTVTVGGPLRPSSSSSTPGGGGAAAAVQGLAHVAYADDDPANAHASSAAASTASTAGGACPATIGWNGNYGSPVTLSSPPHAGRGGVGAVATATATTVTTVTSPTATATVTGAPGCAKASKRQARRRHSDGNGEERRFIKV